MSSTEATESYHSSKTSNQLDTLFDFTNICNIDIKHVAHKPYIPFECKEFRSQNNKSGQN